MSRLVRFPNIKEFLIPNINLPLKLNSAQDKTPTSPFLINSSVKKLTDKFLEIHSVLVTPHIHREHCELLLTKESN